VSPAHVEASAVGNPPPNTTAGFHSIHCHATLWLPTLCRQGTGPATSARTLQLLSSSRKFPLLNLHLHPASSSSLRSWISETDCGSVVHKARDLTLLITPCRCKQCPGLHKSFAGAPPNCAVAVATVLNFSSALSHLQSATCLLEVFQSSADFFSSVLTSGFTSTNSCFLLVYPGRNRKCKG